MITAQATGRPGRHRAGRVTRNPDTPRPGLVIRDRPPPRPAWARVVAGYWPALAEPLLTLVVLAALLAAAVLR